MMVMGNCCFESILVGITRRLRDISRKNHPNWRRRFEGCLEDTRRMVEGGIGGNYIRSRNATRTRYGESVIRNEPKEWLQAVLYHRGIAVCLKALFQGWCFSLDERM